MAILSLCFAYCTHKFLYRLSYWPHRRDMKINLNKFFDLIVLAKNSDYYSKKELDLFYQIWKIEYEKSLKAKSPGNKPTS